MGLEGGRVWLEGGWFSVLTDELVFSKPLHLPSLSKLLFKSHSAVCVFSHDAFDFNHRHALIMHSYKMANMAFSLKAHSED